MALFSLTDIQFNVPGVRTGISQLTDNNEFNLNTFRYPIDLGSVDKGHYMVININEQKNTSFPGEQVAGVLPTIKANQAEIRQQFGNFDTARNLGIVAENVGAIANELIRVFGGGERAGGRIGEGLSLIEKTGRSITNDLKEFGVRSVRRITDTIALYMPDTLTFEYRQGYSDLRPGEQLGGQVAALGSSIAQTIQAGGSENIIKENLSKNLSPFAFKLFSDKIGSVVGGDVGKILFTGGAGGAISNPMLELIYSSPSFRQFRFDFMLYPRSQNEAIEVNNILSKLRFHQAPELVKNTGGAFLYPPSEFDISFYYNGQINPNIPQISTCVLTDIEVDYAPNGFTSYEVQGRSAEYGGTGMPVAIRLSLSFKETEYLVKGSPSLALDRTSTNIRNSQLGRFGTS